MAGERTKDAIDRFAEASRPLVDRAQPVVERALAATKPLVETARPYAERAAEATKPVIERANGFAQPYVKRANEAAQPFLERARPVVEPFVDNARRFAERIAESPAVTEAREQARTVIPRTAPPRGTGETAQAAADVPLEQWTRAQLYERAQDLEIEGRSQMSKQELLEALKSRT